MGSPGPSPYPAFWARLQRMELSWEALLLFTPVFLLSLFPGWREGGVFFSLQLDTHDSSTIPPKGWGVFISSLFLSVLGCWGGRRGFM